MREALHLLKNFIDIWHHILAINNDGSVGAVPQSHVEHSAALYARSTRKQNTLRHTYAQQCGIDPITVGCLYYW